MLCVPCVPSLLCVLPSLQRCPREWYIPPSGDVSVHFYSRAGCHQHFFVGAGQPPSLSTTLEYQILLLLSPPGPPLQHHRLLLLAAATKRPARHAPNQERMLGGRVSISVRCIIVQKVESANIRHSQSTERKHYGWCRYDCFIIAVRRQRKCCGQPVLRSK